MHRSGTSLLAGVLERLGVALPGDVIAGDQHNPSGYFEWADVVALQERLLIDLDRWWPSAAGVEPLPADWLSAPATTAFRAALRGRLERSMAQQRTLGDQGSAKQFVAWIWIDLARNWPPSRFVLAVRDPAEVVQSLVRRDAAVTGMNLGRAQRLWWLHNLSVLHAFDDPRKLVVVDDSGWFRDPVAQLSHLEGAIPELCPTEEQRREALARLTPGIGMLWNRQCVSPCTRESLHRRLLRQPLPCRWPSARPPSSLPGDSAALPSARELIAAPERWQPLLDELKHIRRCGERCSIRRCSSRCCLVVAGPPGCSGPPISGCSGCLCRSLLRVPSPAINWIAPTSCCCGVVRDNRIPCCPPCASA